ncbi:hypothetical protein [Methylocystis silviterrae]|uniref:hypothetical protein n=1 Tax=Methylocystis silviterrae TaxID=2743612 RepID=UPI003C75E832
MKYFLLLAFACLFFVMSVTEVYHGELQPAANTGLLSLLFWMYYMQSARIDELEKIVKDFPKPYKGVGAKSTFSFDDQA